MPINPGWLQLSGGRRHAILALNPASPPSSRPTGSFASNKYLKSSLDLAAILKQRPEHAETYEVLVVGEGCACWGDGSREVLEGILAGGPIASEGVHGQKARVKPCRQAEAMRCVHHWRTDPRTGLLRVSVSPSSSLRAHTPHSRRRPTATGQPGHPLRDRGELRAVGLPLRHG